MSSKTPKAITASDIRRACQVEALIVTAKLALEGLPDSGEDLYLRGGITQVLELAAAMAGENVDALELASGDDMEGAT